MKTGIEWIATIKNEGIRAELLCNTDNYELIRGHLSLWNFMVNAFVYSNTFQGTIFWLHVSHAIYNGEEI